MMNLLQKPQTEAGIQMATMKETISSIGGKLLGLSIQFDVKMDAQTAQMATILELLSNINAYGENVSVNNAMTPVEDDNGRMH
jgi:hypothetical protein